MVIYGPFVPHFHLQEAHMVIYFFSCLVIQVKYNKMHFVDNDVYALMKNSWSLLEQTQWGLNLFSHSDL
jgi:hypothetical protein